VATFLTGGTGLVGSHLAEALRARGTEVVCLQRPRSETSHLRRLGCRVVQGDVRDAPEVLARAIEGCTTLVHGAAMIYARASWPKVRAVNVEGTARILRAAVEAGVERAVHLSSVAVYGDVEGSVDEETPPEAPLRPSDLYGRSKREAEAVALDLHGRKGLSVTVLRPGAIYGERDRLFAPRLIRFTRLPLVPLLGRGDVPLPVVYAGNVADAILGILDASGTGGRIYNLAVDRPTTQRDLLAGLARGLDRKVRFLTVPAFAVRWGAAFADALGVKIPGARDLPLRRVARFALAGNPYRSRRIRSEIAWEPPHPPDEALERTGAWFGEKERREEGA